jgi:hypothetical protein
MQIKSREVLRDGILIYECIGLDVVGSLMWRPTDAATKLASLPNRWTLFNKSAGALAKILRLLEPFLRFIT